MHITRRVIITLNDLPAGLLEIDLVARSLVFEMFSSIHLTTRVPVKPSCPKCHKLRQQRSCTAAGIALKTAACLSDRVVSALRNHVHYIVNYVFEGHRPQDPRGEVDLGANHRRA